MDDPVKRFHPQDKAERHREDPLVHEAPDDLGCAIHHQFLLIDMCAYRFIHWELAWCNCNASHKPKLNEMKKGETKRRRDSMPCQNPHSKGNGTTRRPDGLTKAYLALGIGDGGARLKCARRVSQEVAKTRACDGRWNGGGLLRCACCWAI
ncbi:hypothetical protein TRIATDRAFT_89458 [Trichoderma atroviride IMI 206040]|uniref:Uncharacterized protein n=1 Tax=Hypocrea atroviridis (strain ATCC 20476 / IMI 206040) TaxID=452589 RepID=G9P9J7_HYPAI|nr:uncharacterized protein TRIATDRAFT_89458 [Trichoderma atroviride IMI 206040]EHK40319.1 hypothetical protein TRIATDRAFT_89458 [Trichoderma atroviride IMI 206040]